MKSITILLFALTLISSARAQNSLTNTVKGVQTIRGPQNIGGAMFDISGATVRICSEINTSYIDDHMSFTNATLGHILDNVMNINTNYILRYEASNDSFYVFPATNALTMMRCSPISVTNMPVKTLFKEKDIFGIKKQNTDLADKIAGMWFWADETVTLDFDDAFVWQIMDAICGQLPNGQFWMIFETKKDNDCFYTIYFHTPLEREKDSN